MNSRTALRLTIWLSAIAALTAVIVMLFIVTHMNRTHGALQRDSLLGFSFVQQADHNLETLATAARSLRDAGPAERRERAEQLLLRYDVLYSMMSLSSSRWTDSVMQIDGAPDLVQRMRRATLALEPLMLADTEWAAASLDAIDTDTTALAHELHRIGSLAFHRESALRDDIVLRMNRLIRLFWIFGALLLLAGLTLYLSMARALSLAARSVREADLSRRQLESALEELTTGDIDRKARNRFLAAATHDLRQPLQAMQYYLAALQPHVDNLSGHRILERITRSTDSAQAMLTDLLEISKLDAGVLVPRCFDIDVDELLGRLCEEFTVEAGERGLTLRRHGHAGWSRTDPQLLERVLRNLIGNALSHTERGGVTLDARSDGTDSLMLEVRDTGIGIPERELETVFNEYHQAENSQRFGAGLGLGLSIVRRLTRLLEIPLTVDSVPGRGTRFSLRLPAARPAPRSSASALDDAHRKRCAGSVQGLAVLVIDDDEAVREGVATLLQQRGCQVACAADLNGALTRLVDTELVPDLLLVDYRLPRGRTGLEAIDVIREELNEDVPALVVTGDTAPALLRRAHACEVQLLHKPIDAPQLFRSIDALLHSPALADSASPGP